MAFEIVLPSNLELFEYSLRRLRMQVLIPKVISEFLFEFKRINLMFLNSVISYIPQLRRGVAEMTDYDLLLS